MEELELIIKIQEDLIDNLHQQILTKEEEITFLNNTLQYYQSELSVLRNQIGR